ncbi:hypothetical protein C8Q74DRAFT_1234939 [Fomes fomentarius]|nr:hypothetical protein C8Q74DRAFT_1234939 [Fomes fomentarius]
MSMCPPPSAEWDLSTMTAQPLPHLSPLPSYMVCCSKSLPCYVLSRNSLWSTTVRQSLKRVQPTGPGAMIVLARVSAPRGVVALAETLSPTLTCLFSPSSSPRTAHCSRNHGGPY